MALDIVDGSCPAPVDRAAWVREAQACRHDQWVLGTENWHSGEVAAPVSSVASIFAMAAETSATQIAPRRREAVTRELPDVEPHETYVVIVAAPARTRFGYSVSAERREAQRPSHFEVAITTR